MIKFISPRIHNLGDFVNCLPTLSGVYKTTGEKIFFIICDNLQRFKGIKELLINQEMFCEVKFCHEINEINDALLIDDIGSDENCGNLPFVTARYADFIRKRHHLNFEIDEKFELFVPKMNIDYLQDMILVGDRWSSNESSDVDIRRNSHVIKNSKILDHKKTHYLDYSKDLIYNCSLIKYNQNIFISTFTGISIIADLLNKKQIVVWGDDLHNWNNKPIEYSFRMHYFFDRKSTISYIKNLKVS